MNNGGSLLLIIAILPFLGALVPGIMIRAGRNACASFTAAPTILAIVMLGTLAPSVMQGEVIRAEITWLPQLGLSASFFLDGLGLLFAGMILGVGCSSRFMPAFTFRVTIRWGSSIPICFCSRARCWGLSCPTISCFC